MRALVYGVGATGARVARHLASNTAVEKLDLVDTNDEVLGEVVASIGDPTVAVRPRAGEVAVFAELAQQSDVVVLTAVDDHVEYALAALEAGAHVISTSDDVDTVAELRALDAVARTQGKTLVMGAGFSPGLSCVLSVHAGRRFDLVDEVHIAKFGTGGPACARQHHRALRNEGLDWHEGDWVHRRGSSGRELCWFPDPVGGLDCYHAALPEVSLLLPAFDDVKRATARVAATRRDRSTKWLPMLRKPHPEGLIGAVRVEVRGWAGEERAVNILGVLDRPAVAAGHVAGLSARWAHEGKFAVGASGLAALVGDTRNFLQEMARVGVKAAVFEGALAGITEPKAE